MKNDKFNLLDKFDLLSTVEYGGCSAKIPAGELGELLSGLPILKDNNVMVDISTHDDAGVYKLNDTTALIVTTDFFPPICSDPYDFGQIAAANSLSDVYAMGGTPLLVLNLNMFPSKTIPLEVLKDIMTGGQEKVNEAGAFTMGGHTIEDSPVKYGLAVVGTIHPDKVRTNANARVGDKIILTKRIGTGTLIAGRRLGMTSDEAYDEAIELMKSLNKVAGDVMQRYDISSATDITGFALVGHALKMAESSGVTIQINSEDVPLLPQVEELLDMGCVSGATMRNLEYVAGNTLFASDLDPIKKLAMGDAQTSGGLFMCIKAEDVDQAMRDLKADESTKYSAVIGEVLPLRRKNLYIM